MFVFLPMARQKHGHQSRDAGPNSFELGRALRLKKLKAVRPRKSLGSSGNGLAYDQALFE